MVKFFLKTCLPCKGARQRCSCTAKCYAAHGKALGARQSRIARQTLPDRGRRSDKVSPLSLQRVPPYFPSPSSTLHADSHASPPPPCTPPPARPPLPPPTPPRDDADPPPPPRPRPAAPFRPIPPAPAPSRRPVPPRPRPAAPVPTPPPRPSPPCSPAPPSPSSSSPLPPVSCSCSSRELARSSSRACALVGRVRPSVCSVGFLFFFLLSRCSVGFVV